MYKAIFLDVDDTLLDFNACARDCMRRGLEDRGEVFQDEMFPIFLKINLGFWHRIETGEIDREYLAAHRWNTVFEALGLSHLDGTAFETDFRKFLNESAILMPDACETAAWLSRRYPLYVATNGPQYQQENRLRKAGLLPHIRGVFTSEAIGFEKPARSFFDACFAHLPGIAPDEVLFVGDSLTADIHGGISYGMATCWFNPKRQPCPPDIIPDYIISSLPELQKIL